MAKEIQASEVITLEQYLAEVKVNKGLVASFVFEAKVAGQVDADGKPTPRSKEEWATALDAQSKKEYK